MDIRNHLPAHQSISNRLVYQSVHTLLVRETKLHLRGMYVYIQKIPVQLKMQDRKGIFVLHHEVFVSVLDGFGDDGTPDVSAVDEIVLIIPVSPGNDGLSDIASQRSKGSLPVDLHEIRRDLPAIDSVNDILQVGISRGMQPVLVIVDKFEGNLRMRQGQPFHQIVDITCLSLRAFEKFPANRRIIEHIAYLKGRTFRRSDLLGFRGLFLSAFNNIANAGQLSCRLGNKLHLANRRNTGKSLSTESQGSDAEKILRLRDLAGGVAHKGFFHLAWRDAFPVVGDPHQRGAAVLDLHSHSVGTRVDGIFHQLFYNGRRPLDDLASRDLVNGIFIQYRNCFHELPHLFLSRFCNR